MHRKKLIVGPTASEILEMSKYVFIAQFIFIVVMIGHVNSYFSVHRPVDRDMPGMESYSCETYVNISVANTWIFLGKKLTG